MPPRDADRLTRYVHGFYARSGGQFPSVRRAARSLGWTYQRVEDACEDDTELDLTSYFAMPEDPLGDHIVESYTVVPSHAVAAPTERCAGGL